MIVTGPGGTEQRNDVVDLRDASSVELWCAALRVSTAELVEAVTAVGDCGDQVAEYIRRKRRSRSTNA
jgi:hypothetical protein